MEMIERMYKEVTMLRLKELKEVIKKYDETHIDHGKELRDYAESMGVDVVTKQNIQSVYANTGEIIYNMIIALDGHINAIKTELQEV